MNVLLCAYACEPNNGSEPEVGWQMANEIAKAIPEDTVNVITKKNNKTLIEQESYPENLIFHYYELPKWLSFWKKGGRGIRTYYYLWMIGAAHYMRAKNISFKIIHHVTFVNDWLPSFFSILKNKSNKFIWGPIGSHDQIDPKFLDGSKRKNIEKIRIFLQLFFRNIDPSFHYCKAKSNLVVGINSNVKNKLSLKENKKFIAEPAIGMSRSVVEKVSQSKKNNDTFLVISVGRLLYIKNFKLTILVFSEFLKSNPGIKNAKLQIIGDGEDRKDLKALTDKLKIAEYVEFVGNVTMSEVQDHLSLADVFLFPTLENAGFVIIEAMSHALPVLAMDYGGPQQFVINNKKEQLVSSTQSYNNIVIELAKNLEKFYFDKQLCNKIGDQNHKDVLDNFTWEAKAQKIKKLYKEVLNET